MIAAIWQAQYRAMRFFGRGSVFGMIAGAIWYGGWLAIACGVAYWTAIATAAALARGVAWGLLGVFLYWQFVPLISATMGASLDMRKLLIFPAPHYKLFLVEVLLRFTTGIEVILVLIGGTIGTSVNSAMRGAIPHARLVAAVLAFMAFNLLLASGLRSVLERLLSRRRVREWVALLMTMVWVMPRFLMQNGTWPKWMTPALHWTQLVGLPWTAAAHAALSGPGIAAWSSLLVWTVFAAWFGRAQFERSLRFDPIAAQSQATGPLSTASGLAERFYRLPSVFLPDPVAGLIEKELRSLARTPRFRMVFVMGFTFGLVLWLPVGMNRASGSGRSSYFLTMVSVYALTLLGQVSYWNCFAFDRSAVLFYYAAPQPFFRVLAAKNIAALIYIYLEVLVLSAVTLLLHLGVGVRQVIETLLVMGVCSLYMLALGNLSSVHYPRPVNPERVAQGSGSGFQGLLFLLYPLALLPVLLAYLARYAFASELAFVLMLGLAAAVGGVLYKVAIDSAVNRSFSHREQVLQELSKGDGPVVSG
jgi:ABC-2 type transport system permease protein